MLSLSARAAGLQQQGSEDRIFGDRFLEPAANKIPDSIRILNRLTFGATQELRAEFNSLGRTLEERTQRYVEQQLNPNTINDADCEDRILAGEYESLDKSIQELWADYLHGDLQRNIPVREVEAAKIVRATCSRRQVYERMVDFWHDHFNIFGPRPGVRESFPQFDRDAVRLHALGNFRQLLEATAKSTAMLYYLDNHASRVGGFNENYARELIELHTMGAEVYFPTIDPFEVPLGPDRRPLGYCDEDVFEAARCLTGWTVLNNARDLRSLPEANTGAFIYFDQWHDSESKFFLRRSIPADQAPMADGQFVFDQLCSHSATARFLCRKLIRRFITDEPNPDLVESAAQLWQQHWQAPNQIAIVLRHILTAENLLAETTPKLRRPFELLIAALRQTGSTVAPLVAEGGVTWGRFFNLLQGTGQRPFRWAPPDGYPDRAIDWISASSLAMSWRMLSHLVEMTSDDEPVLPIVEPTRQQFSPNQRTARNLVDWWLDRLLGFRPTANRYQELLDFMRQNAGPDEPLDLDTRLPHGRGRTGNLAEHFVPARLRTMVGLIYMLPEFQVR